MNQKDKKKLAIPTKKEIEKMKSKKEFQVKEGSIIKK